MVGKVIEGRYAGASVNKLPDRNVLFIQTEDGTKIALSKSNAISIDDVTDQYPSYGRKVMMVMWNDFETSIIQLGLSNAGEESQKKQNIDRNISSDNQIQKYNPSQYRHNGEKQKLICEMCGKTDWMKQDGMFVCQHCGCKYSVGEARKMMGEDRADIRGNVIQPDKTKQAKTAKSKKKKVILALVLLFTLLLGSVISVKIIDNMKLKKQEQEKLERYEAILQQINTSTEGERNLWDAKKTDPELKEFILVNLDDTAVENLYKWHNSWRCDYIFIVIEDVFSVGVEKVSVSKIQTLLFWYMDSRKMDGGKINAAVEHINELYENGAYEELEQYIYDIRSGKIYSGDPRKDIEDFLLTRAEGAIISRLKDPDSYKRTSYSCNVNLDETSGKFDAKITVTYTATNSFGGRVTDTYSLSYDGTIVDGKISSNG